MATEVIESAGKARQWCVTAMIVIFRLLAWSEAVKCWQGTNCQTEYELEPSKVRREEEDDEEEERENNKS